jgi:preprotein translocase subunit SecY
VSSTSGSAERSSGRTILAVILGIIALVFIVVAIIYIAEPAQSLPSFVPGRIAGSTGHHPLRVVGSLVIGIVFAVGAWFALAYKPKPQATAQNNKESSPAGRS